MTLYISNYCDNMVLYLKIDKIKIWGMIAMKIFYQAVVALLLTAILACTATAATEETGIFVGSTSLAKTLYKELDKTSATFVIYDAPDHRIVTDAMLEALAQNPYAALATKWNTKTRSSHNNAEITMNYVHNEETRKKQKAELTKKVKSIVKKIIKDGMTTEQKTDAIQRYIAANCEYDYDTLKLITDGKNSEEKSPDSFTAYGALIKGKAVCQGYANAFKALADAAGVRNVIIFGVTNNGIPHSWNRVYDNKIWNTADVSNLDLNMWQQTGAYVAPATVKARLVPNKQTIVDSQWSSLFSSGK